MPRQVVYCSVNPLLYMYIFRCKINIVAGSEKPKAAKQVHDNCVPS